MHQVAIIGGGLAGLAAAIGLAKHHIEVTLYEKGDYPRHRVCGEYLSLESIALLRALDIDLSDYDLPHISKLWVTGQHGAQLRAQLPLGAVGISRYMLDHLLYLRALALGVQVQCNTEVRGLSQDGHQHLVSTDQGQQAFDLVIMATGKRSNLDTDRKARPAEANFVGVKYHVEADLPSDLISLHNFENGYAGISQVEQGRFCLCYLTTAAMLRKAGGSIPQLEEQVMAKNPALKQVLSYPRYWKQPETIAQFHFDPRPSVQSQYLMLGDAAGLISPLAGNGMSMALLSAAIAVPLVISMLSGKAQWPEVAAQYSQAYQHHFGTRLQVSRVLQRLLFSPQLTDISIRGLSLAPWLTKQVIKATHGQAQPTLGL